MVCSLASLTAATTESASERLPPNRLVTADVLLAIASQQTVENGIESFKWSGDGKGVLVEVAVPPAGSAERFKQQETVKTEYVPIVRDTLTTAVDGNARSPHAALSGRQTLQTAGRWPAIDSVTVLDSAGNQTCEISSVSIDANGAAINAAALSPDGKRIAIAVGVSDLRQTTGDKGNHGREKSLSTINVDEPTVVVHSYQKNRNADAGGIFNTVSAVLEFNSDCEQIGRLAAYKNSYIGQLAWSPSGDEVLASVHYREEGLSHGYTNLELIRADGGRSRLFIGNIGGQASPNDFLSFSPDGTHLAFHYDLEGQPAGGRYQIAVASLKTGHVTALSEELRMGVRWISNTALWVVTKAPHILQSKSLIFTINGEEAFIDGLPGSARPSPQMNKVAWIERDLYGDSDLWIADLEEREGRLNVSGRHVIRSVPSPFSAYARGERQLINCVSDGLSIAGMLVYPLEYDNSKAYPLIVDIHGGPTGAFSTNRHPSPVGSLLKASSIEHDYWAAKGYVVLAPDYRASGMYGFDAVARDGTELENDLQDIMCQVDSLIDRQIVDENRMAVIGHSYGAVQTTWIVTHLQRFRAAVAYEGGRAGDFLLAWAADGSVNRSLNIKLGSALNFPEHYRRLSVLEASRDVVTPTMFVSSYGGRQPGNAYSWLYASWRFQGVAAEHRIYHDEGHVLQKPANQRDLLVAASEWIERRLSVQSSHHVQSD